MNSEYEMYKNQYLRLEEIQYMKESGIWSKEAQERIENYIQSEITKGKQEADMGFAEFTSIFNWEYSQTGKKWYHKINNTDTRVDSEYLYQIYLNWLEENKTV